MSIYKKEIIVIVNAYLSGAYLAEKFLNEGYKCLHVTTRLGWENGSYKETFRDKDFIKTIFIESEFCIETAVEELRKYEIKLIIAGSESGVTLADNLANDLGLSINQYEFSSARRNKFEMQEVLKKKNLRSILQMKSADVQDIIQWKNENHLNRIVLKPLRSSASDSVFYCEDEYSIRSSFALIYNKNDIFGNKNEEVLAQEYIDGPEYIVNTVSLNGKHFFIDVWKGYSPDTNKVSNDSYADLVSPNDPQYKLIYEYLSNVLSALGVRAGPTHSEIRIDKSGACLIEVGVRLAGRVDFSAVDKIYGCSQLSLSVEAFLNPESFASKWDQSMVPLMHARYVYFFSDIEGLVNKDLDLTKFEEIKTLYSVKFFIKKGDLLQKTSKAFRVKRPGFAYLISNDLGEINRDYCLIKKVEERFYEILVGMSYV